MAQDIADLMNFYATPLGKHVTAQIEAMLHDIWPNLSSRNFLSIGYPLPFIDYYHNTQRSLVCMPAKQGIIHWPDETKNACCLVDEDLLPFPNDSMDRIFLVHSLEHAEHLHKYLREVWRVLTANGRVLIIVPNRRGVWARIEETPFGHGNPYTMTQLMTLLKENQFTPLRSSRTLYSLPTHSRVLKKLSILLEKAGPSLLSKFSGLICIEATKKIYCGLPEKKAPFIFLKPAQKPSASQI